MAKASARRCAATTETTMAYRKVGEIYEEVPASSGAGAGVGILVVLALIYFGAKQGCSRQGGPPGQPSQPQTGQIVLRTVQRLLPGVKAFVEVDGQRVKDWPNDKMEVTVTVSAGSRRVIVRSKLGANHYKKEFSTLVPAGGVVELLLEAVEPDPGAKW